MFNWIVTKVLCFKAYLDDPEKAMFRGKFLSLNLYIRNKGKQEIHEP